MKLLIADDQPLLRNSLIRFLGSMTYGLFSLQILLAISCGKPAPVPTPAFSAIVYYKNQSGADLLNPSTQGAYNQTDVNVYDLIASSGGTTRKLSKPSIDCSEYVCQPGAIGNYAVEFEFNPSPTYSETILVLSTTVSDTLVYQIIPASQQSGYLVKQVSYKGQVIWNIGTKTPMIFTITK